MTPHRTQVLAVVNQKGGVGKTTTAVNLAASVAASERETLLVDLDPQANASSAYGISAPSAQIYDALIGRRVMKEIAQPTKLPHLRVAPSGSDLVGAEIELVSVLNRERRLERALSEARGDYRAIFIDCPPSLGLLTLNALTAADAVIIPLQCEYYALEGLARLLETVELVRAQLNPGLHVGGIVMTMVDDRNNLARQVQEEVREHFGDRVFQTVIPRNVRLSEAPSHGMPILLYDIRSKGATAYLRLTEELLRRMEPESDAVADAPATATSTPAVPATPASFPAPSTQTPLGDPAPESEPETAAKPPPHSHEAAVESSTAPTAPAHTFDSPVQTASAEYTGPRSPVPSPSAPATSPASQHGSPAPAAIPPEPHSAAPPAPRRQDGGDDGELA